MKTAALKTPTAENNREKTRKLVSIGMLAGIATILMLFEFPLPFIAPTFYELDFSEVPILIGAFAFGPMAGVMTEFVKILINLVINGTDTAFVGEFANFIMGCMLVLPASLVYQRKKSRRSAIIGLVLGTVCLTVGAVIVNALIMLPFYANVMPLEAILNLGAAINPAIDSIWSFAIIAVGPFNLIKGVLVSVMTVVLYKHISPILKGHH